MNDRHGLSTGGLLTQRLFGQRLSIVSLLVAALALGCGGGSSPTEPDPSGCVVGSGNFVTESLIVGGFNGVSAPSGATVIIEQTGSESLTVTAEDNILPLLRSDNVGGRLVLGPQPGTSICAGERVYELTVRNLNEVSGLLASTVEITRIDTPLPNVTLGAVAVMTIAGTADEQVIDIGGPPSYNGAELQSRVARINASGSSADRVPRHLRRCSGIRECGVLSLTESAGHLENSYDCRQCQPLRYGSGTKRWKQCGSSPDTCAYSDSSSEASSPSAPGGSDVKEKSTTP